ncbi:hypothetical protein LCGC14_0816950 [marine sediment metagenome]|uniref:CRISPR system Cms protein Csm2 n=1 Tax=marine sediment metagenome TaxID=412755 RepID=A0A0F9PPM5_9ZZZZ
MSYRRNQSRRPSSRDEMSDLVRQITANSSKLLSKETSEDIELFLNLSEKFGEKCSKRISTSQIRAIFTLVKRLSDNYNVSKKDLNLLRPKLAYQKGRFPALGPLTQVLDHLIKNVKDNSTLKGFKEFFEAIIAYHKAYGGKE